MVEYELQMAYERCNRMMTRYRLYRKEEKLENLDRRLVIEICLKQNFSCLALLLS